MYVPTEIIGTVEDETLLRYTLEYSQKDQNVWITFARGETPVSNGVLGTLDTTLMQNGLFDIRLTAEDASGNIEIVETVYQIDGNMKIGIYPNGIITEYGYDNLNRLISVETRTLMSDIIASYTYTLNAKGQRTHVEERVGTQLVRTIDYTYDAADRLTEEKIDDVVTGLRTITYTYDPVGNCLTKDDNGVITTYDYDDNDRLLTEACPEQCRRGGFSYGYDNNGNLLSKTGNGEQHTFSYNALNQLVQTRDGGKGQRAKGKGSCLSPFAFRPSPFAFSSVYDHDGIRVGKTINGTDIIKYVVDKNRPYAQVLEEQWTNGALSATTSYVYGDALISQTSNGATQFYHYDGMGGTRTLTDMTGAITDTYSYNAYGMLLDKTGGTINPYLYRGEQFDDDLSAYYLRARYYQPGIGRFMSTDPIEGFPTTPMSLHRYVYGNDDPISYMDPSGNLTLNESLVVAAEISFLSMLTFSECEKAGFGVYSGLAKHVFPEAYIVGFNMTGKLPPPVSYYLAVIFPDDLMPPFHLFPLTAAFGGVGLELLLSVGSGEGAWFFTVHYGLEVAVLPNLSFGFELYDGFVFNLWNAKDYKGPFQSLTLNLGFEKIKGGWSLFWDAKRSFAGPWEGTSTFLSKSFSYHTQEAFGMSKSNTSYIMLGEPDQSLSRSDVVGSIVTILLGTKFIEAIDKGGNVTPLACWLFETSIWVHTGLAHHYWNLKEPQYNMEKRRTVARDKAPEFHSGPAIWRLPL